MLPRQFQNEFLFHFHSCIIVILLGPHLPNIRPFTSARSASYWSNFFVSFFSNGSGDCSNEAPRKHISEQYNSFLITS